MLPPEGDDIRSRFGPTPPAWSGDHRHRFQDAGAGVRPPDADFPGRGPPDRSQRALAAAGFVDGPDVRRRVIVPGVGCLVKERQPTLSFEIFEEMLRGGVPGLLITRIHPDRIRHDRGLTDVRMIWLSHTPGEDYHEPTATGTLVKVIQKFIEDNNGEGVILLDGLEYLMINNGFVPILFFVEQLNELMTLSRGILLLPVDPRALDLRELALLERNVMVLEG